MKFDLQGQNWQWDTYKADQIIARGSFENGVLTCCPYESSLKRLGGPQRSSWHDNLVSW